MRKSELKRRQLPAPTSDPSGGTRTGVEARGPAPATERRNHLMREEILRRITLEYEQLPGLRLTSAQARRLFGLPEDVCERALDTLVHAAVLRQEPNGMFAANSRRRVSA